MQREFLHKDAALFQFREQLLGEMQPGSRRRYRTFFAGKQSLVVAPILLVGLAARGDVWRKRHVPQRRDRLLEVGSVQAEGEINRSAFAFGRDSGIELAEQADAALVSELYAVADLQSLGRPRQSAPAALVQMLDEVEGDVRPGFAAITCALERGCDHARVVENQRVARSQQARKFAHDAVFVP